MRSLSPRETEIVRLVARGLPTKAIADDLGIRETTVKWHVAQLLRRYDARSRLHLIAILVGVRDLSPDGQSD